MKASLNSGGLAVRLVVVSILKTDNHRLSNMSSAVCSTSGVVGV